MASFRFLAGDKNRWHQTLAQSAKSIIKNPMIIGITAGIVYGSFDLHFPQVFETTIGLVATAESPVALFVIGGSLVGLKLTGQRTDIAAVVIGKLILHPLTVLAVLAALALVAPPMDAKLTQAAVLFAAMPMLSIYPVLAQKYDLAPFCAAAPLATTVASFFTISALLWVLPLLPGLLG